MAAPSSFVQQLLAVLADAKPELQGQVVTLSNDMLGTVQAVVPTDTSSSSSTRGPA